MTEHDEPTHEEQQLPSGKKIFRAIDADGQLIREDQMYGMLDIGITSEFIDGVKASETYFVNRRMVSRKRYEKTRTMYADMPVADTGVEDFGDELTKLARAERRQKRQAAKNRKADPERARQNDEFCKTLLETGTCEDATRWIESKKTTLGEYSHTKSRNIVRKLNRLGARHVYACNIDRDEESYENTGALVVELPEDIESRRVILREIGRLAEAQGFDADSDDGQQFAFMKLD
jgi:hypothetical protein